MPARQPKEGIGFELYVAAALRTEPHTCDGKSLDLTDFYFEIIPRTYRGEVTHAGYDVEVDITARNYDVEYLIECKSSRYRDEVLDINSDKFLKSMLEFLALELFYGQMGWNANYVLAVNFPVARKLVSLEQQTSARPLEKFRNLLVEFGHKEHGEIFNPDVASTERIIKVLRALTLLELPDQYLRTKMRSDKNFRENYEMFSSRLKKLHSQLASKGGLTEMTRFETISFLCKSPEHNGCRDIPVDAIVCHIGKIDGFISKLEEFQKGNASGIKMVRTNQLGFSRKDFVYAKHLSSKEVSVAITKALNTLIENSYSIYVVPGTFDVILIDKDRMVNRIKRCFNSETLKYQLDDVKELADLGASLKVSVAQFILSKYHLSPGENDFVAEEEIF